jgi:hypothetical protein
MSEFRQFGYFIPRFWQEDGILVEVEMPVPRRPRMRSGGPKWIVALATSTIVLGTAVTSFSYSVPDAGAGRRATVTEEAGLSSGPSRYTEVSPDHWVTLRTLMKSFKRTPLMDEFKYPDPL